MTRITKKKAKKKPGKKNLPKPGSGRVFGNPNKSTLEIRERLKQLDCDPLHYVAKILNGEEKPQTHPVLYPALKQLKIIKKNKYRISKYKIKPVPVELVDELADSIEDLESLLVQQLGPGSYIDPKIRVKIATDLLSYLHPRQQAIVHSSDSVKPNTPVDQITDQALVSIAINILEKSDGEKELEKLKRAVECVNEDV